MTSKPPASADDPRLFRRALGNFATGVTVMTACGSDGQKVGVTANSFNSVSLDPPLILWSIDKRSGSYPVFASASHFAVNILAADQISLSNRFARPSDDRFAGVPHTQGAGGAPLLEDCAARFVCERHAMHDGGDHWIMLGKVVALDDFGRAPLLYHQGSYAMALPHSLQQKKELPALACSNLQKRLDNNIYYLLTQAVRTYQNHYQPRQLATGLRTSEARMLLVLEDGLDLAALHGAVNMPEREVEQAVAMLLRKELISLQEQHYRLTEQGRLQAEALHDLAEQQQQELLGGFDAEQVSVLKNILQGIIRQR
ncbi:p-hydroxyphenylacetate 3-hydroxylase reductase component [Aquitalea denitrificans]|uniref:p-hydroxyphenylacetate 3-hydroxylase reductase component n=1 Tax=Aquitalea denitrificans TaxID=519081 RepID=UPI00135CE147|nr:flavin reductase [Aquitalea denitrificans]